MSGGSGASARAVGAGCAYRRVSTRERRIAEMNRLAINAAACERVLSMAEHLEEPERVLVLAVYRDGMTPSAIARLRGTTAARVRRSVARAVTRVLSRSFAVVATQGHAWPRERRDVARACVLHGHGVREAARRAGVSMHAARREMVHVRAVVEAVGAMRAAG